MAANYANIYRVGGLDAGFQQVPLVQTETLTIIYKEKTKLSIYIYKIYFLFLQNSSLL